jgi:hypothetical protein
MRLANLTGHVFGKLRVLERAENNSCGHVRWLCVCECGDQRVVSANNLRAGHTQSCGCLKGGKPGQGRSHGLSRSPAYRSWAAMIARCDAAESDRPYYSGVRVCDRWRTFENFLEDMGPRPRGTSIDRIDGAGDYEPGNCRWATPTEQVRNRSNTKRYTYRGRSLVLAEWGAVVGIDAETLRQRIFAGWTVERALTTPLNRDKSRAARGPKKLPDPEVDAGAET